MPTFSQLGRTAARLARRYGPTVARTLRDTDMVERGKALVRDSLEAGKSAYRGEDGTGRPAATTAAPTARRARRIEYSPDLDGEADPGEIVWAWVTFEEQDGRGKDRPVLVVGRSGRTVLGLILSSQSHRANDPRWMTLGSGDWDSQGRTSYLRLDRVLDVPETGIRREGAILPRAQFDAVAERLRSEYGWR